MSRAAGCVPKLSRGLRQLYFVPLLTAAIAIGDIRGTAAQSENDTFMAGRGKVSFAVSCDANLQPRFDAALAALHSFWYGQALKEFAALTEADPDCAMGYWGIAMSVWNQLWAPPRPDTLKAGRDAIEKAGSITRKSPRESDYIEALAVFYSDADRPRTARRRSFMRSRFWRPPIRSTRPTRISSRPAECWRCSLPSCPSIRA
jgi:hypothetical protein